MEEALAANEEEMCKRTEAHNELICEKDHKIAELLKKPTTSDKEAQCDREKRVSFVQEEKIQEQKQLFDDKVESMKKEMSILGKKNILIAKEYEKVLNALEQKKQKEEHARKEMISKDKNLVKKKLMIESLQLKFEQAINELQNKTVVIK
jgi:hypothetical protein